MRVILRLNLGLNGTSEPRHIDEKANICVDPNDCKGKGRQEAGGRGARNANKERRVLQVLLLPYLSSLTARLTAACTAGPVGPTRVRV